MPYRTLTGWNPYKSLTGPAMQRRIDSILCFVFGSKFRLRKYSHICGGQHTVKEMYLLTVQKNRFSREEYLYFEPSSIHFALELLTWGFLNRLPVRLASTRNDHSVFIPARLISRLCDVVCEEIQLMSALDLLLAQSS